MRPKFARSSVLDEPVPRWRAVKWVLPFMLALFGCSAIDAQVGSGLPPTADANAPDAGPARPCDAAAPIRLYYWNVRPADSTNHLDYIVKAENATGSALPLGSLQIRYYLTNELEPPTAIDIYYTDTCCSDKVTNFNTEILTSMQSIPARPNADAYLEIGFAASLGSLAHGDAVQVELGLHAPDYARDMTQTNDYSYLPDATGSQEQWNDCPGAQCASTFTSCAMTVHRDDALVWGTPP
jgi:hypothetical protein